MAWFDEVDARLSRFRPESELSQLNNAGGAWFAASPVLYGAVEAAIRAATASDGLFDPTLLPQLEALGYDRDFSLIAQRDIATDIDARVHIERGDPAPAARLRPAWTPPTQAWRAVELDPDACASACRRARASISAASPRAGRRTSRSPPTASRSPARWST